MRPDIVPGDIFPNYKLPISIDAGMDRPRCRLGGPGDPGSLWIDATNKHFGKERTA
jgi:hypothetical protein